jgi:hypothetical protein
VYFSDTSLDVPGPWRLKKIGRHHPGNVLEGKRFKCQPHKHLGDVEYSIWQDANIVMRASPQWFVQHLKNADVALFAHPDRKCLYREAKVCMNWKLDRAERIYPQLDRYVKEGMPRRWGLFDCSFIVRRHTDEINGMGEMWWNEIRNNSRRDQLSFPYCAWKLGVKIAVISGCPRRGGKNPLLRYHHHRLRKRLYK